MPFSATEAFADKTYNYLYQLFHPTTTKCILEPLRTTAIQQLSLWQQNK